MKAFAALLLCLCPAVGAAELVEGVLYDGPSGVARDHWNRGIAIAWRNKGGDWRDAAGTAQGDKAFATTQMGAKDATVELDATELVRQWKAGVNGGAFLRAGEGGCELVSRESEDAARRPVLMVKTAGGEVECACTADATITGSTYKSLGGEAALVVSKPGSSAVMQFDLSKVAGEVKSARIRLSVSKVRGQCRLELMRLDAPELQMKGEVRQGLAKDFVKDAKIASHADVVFATDFAGEDWRKKYFLDGQITNPTFGTDAELGSTYIRGQFVKGDVGSCSLAYRWSTRKLPEPEEIYFRYYVLLEEDWGSLVDGNKMPGLAGRYGVWNGRIWSPVTGNGGSPTTGLVTKKGEREVLSGWSMRGVGLGKPADENPYRDRVAVITYAYHADQKGIYGDDWRWGTVLLEKNRWYCIEQYAKMNSVAVPLDGLGNGKGEKNGVLRVWVDGVQVFEKSDIRFRHNQKIKIDEVWLNWYHGGTKPAEATHHYRMGNVVVAKSYIGPMGK